LCVQGRVYWGKACAKCARPGFRSFPELFVLPHSRAPADTRTVGLVRHGTCLRRVQGCGIGESVNLDNLGLDITVHESRVTSVQKRMEPRRSLLGASVDVTDARNALCLIRRVLLCEHEGQRRGRHRASDEGRLRYRSPPSTSTSWHVLREFIRLRR